MATRAAAAVDGFTVHESLGALAAACGEGEWDALAAASGNVFASRLWLETWWRHFGRDRPLRLGAHRAADGTLTAIVPLYLASRRPVRMLRFLGHGASDQLGPICARGDERAGAEALALAVAATGRAWDALLADELPTSLPWAPSTGRVLGRQASPVARLSGCTVESWLAARSANLRSQLARAERRLAAAGRVTHRTTAHAEDVARDLDTVIALHDRRWAARGGSRSFVGREAFHHDVCAQAFARGWLRLHVLEVDGEPVAALYNLRFEGAESFYQGGRDPAFDRCSVGLVLHARAIGRAIEDGIDEYRFLRGDEAYKHRFADEDRPLQSIGVARTAPGRATLAAVGRLAMGPRWLVRSIPAPYAWRTGATPRWGAP